MNRNACDLRECLVLPVLVTTGCYTHPLKIQRYYRILAIFNVNRQLRINNLPKFLLLHPHQPNVVHKTQPLFLELSGTNTFIN